MARPLAGGVTAARQVLALVVGVRIPARQHVPVARLEESRTISFEPFKTPARRADASSEECPGQRESRAAQAFWAGALLIRRREGYRTSRDRRSKVGSGPARPERGES